MNLKDYTTEVPADRSIFETERLLADFGADAVMKNFSGDGRIISLAFKMNGKAYNLPANIEGVKRILFARPNLSKKQEDRAYRVTWRILKDWCHAQLSLVRSGQAEPDQILLPYLWDGKKTLYDVYKEGKLQLPHQKQED
jgi:hypothetical protein